MIHRNRLVAAVDDEVLLGLASGGGVYTYGLLSVVWRSVDTEFNGGAYDLMRRIMDEARDCEADLGDYGEYDATGSGSDAFNRVARVKAADMETLRPGFLFEEDRYIVIELLYRDWALFYQVSAEEAELPRTLGAFVHHILEEEEMAEDPNAKAVRSLGAMAGFMERAIELDPALGKDATLKQVLDSGALGKEGPDAPESLSARRRMKKGE